MSARTWSAIRNTVLTSTLKFLQSPSTHDFRDCLPKLKIRREDCSLCFLLCTLAASASKYIRNKYLYTFIYLTCDAISGIDSIFIKVNVGISGKFGDAFLHITLAVARSRFFAFRRGEDHRLLVYYIMVSHQLPWIGDSIRHSSCGTDLLPQQHLFNSGPLSEYYK